MLLNLLSEAIKTFLLAFGGKLPVRIFPPFSVTFCVTKRCNSRCRMCDNWKRFNETGPSKEDLFKMLDKVKNAGIKFVGFNAGGEIFTRNDVFEIFDYAKDLGLLFTINTNGLLLSKYYKDILQANPFNIVVGIDAHNDSLYLEIRGIEKGLTRVMNGVALLKSNGYENINMGVVILPQNVEYLSDILKFASENGFKEIRFTMFQQELFKDEILFKTSDILVDRYKTSFKNLLDECRKHKIAMRNSEAYFNHAINYLINPNKFSPVKCKVGYRTMEVDINGNVYLCTMVNHSIGNLLKQDLLEIWRSKKAREVREKINKGKCNGCWLSCYAEENLRMSTKYFLHNNYHEFKRFLDKLHS